MTERSESDAFREPGRPDRGGPAHGVPDRSDWGNASRPEPARSGQSAPRRDEQGDPDAVGGPAMERLRSRQKDGGDGKVDDKSRPWYIEIPMLIGLALVIVFVFQNFVGRVYQIPSESMETTLHGCPGCTGDRIFVDKITYHFTDPRPGDVVVFEGPPSWSANYTSIRSDNAVIRALQDVGGFIGVVPPDQNDLVKRIVATGGQTVGGCSPEGDLLVDGQPLDEPYLAHDPLIPLNPNNCEFGPVRVPEGNVFVMGDNRNNSADSRFHMGDEHQGTVPESDIIGKVRAIILPLGRIGGVPAPEISPAG